MIKRHDNTKTYSTKEQIHRQFKADVRKTKQKCEDECIKLYKNTAVIKTAQYICVCSTDEYELGEPASNCDLANESYFVSAHDFEVYFEE